MRKRSTAFPPHIFGKNYYKSNWDLIVALAPAFVAGALSYGIGPSLLFLLISALGAACAEIVFSFALSQSFSLDDGWAISMGMLSALVLPPSAPLYIPVLVAALTVLLGKTIPGGLGRSIFSPLILALILIFFIFPGALSYSWPSLEETGQTVIRAKSWYELFLLSSGNQALGSYSLLAILLGAIFLALRNSLDSAVTLSYLLGSSFFLLFSKVPLPAQLFANDSIFFAVFLVPMAGTKPLTLRGKLVYGFLGGLLSAPLRLFLGPVLGIIFSLPFANATVPLLNYLFLPKARSYLLQPMKPVFRVGIGEVITSLKNLLLFLSLAKSKKKPTPEKEILADESGEEGRTPSPVSTMNFQEYKEDAAGFCSFCTETLPECKEFLRTSMSKGWRFFQAADEEGIQGGMILGPTAEATFPVEGENLVHIACLMLRKEKRKRGLGRSLVELAIKVSEDKSGICALAHKSLIPPGFLEHLGFKVVAQRGSWKLSLYSPKGAQVSFSPTVVKARERREKNILEAILPPYCSYLIKNYREAIEKLDFPEGMVEIREHIVSSKEELSSFPFWGIYLNGKLLATGLMEGEKLKAKVLKKLGE
ncbi:MAG: RnfABCDGE type electron transport complex subunit D [bacterium]